MQDGQFFAGEDCPFCCPRRLNRDFARRGDCPATIPAISGNVPGSLAALAARAPAVPRPAAVLAVATSHLIVVVLIVAAIIACLLALPVLYEFLFNSVSAKAERYAPHAILVGLGLLIVGLVSGLAVLDLVGACLAAGVILGAVARYY